jgi:hypothetical protein
MLMAVIRLFTPPEALNRAIAIEITAPQPSADRFMVLIWLTINSRTSAGMALNELTWSAITAGSAKSP